MVEVQSTVQTQTDTTLPHGSVPVAGGASSSLRHESAHLHVAGEARYVDDVPLPPNAVHVALGLSRSAHARILSMDLSAVEAHPDVLCVLRAQDVAHNQISPVGAGDEPLLAEDHVFFYGQPLFAVVAQTRHAARHAAALAQVTYEDKPAVLSIEQARAQGGALVCRSLEMTRGDASQALAAAPHRLAGQLVVGGQEHFYLEGQAALACPGEDGEMRVCSSTQHPTETQHMVAHVLGLSLIHI